MVHPDSHQIPVIVVGALGRMGKEVIKAVIDSPECKLIAAIDSDLSKEGLDIGIQHGIGDIGVFVTTDFEGSLCAASQSVRNESGGNSAVMVDFTHPSVVYDHTRTSIAYGIHPVIGTTGLSYEQIQELNDFSLKASIGAAVIPNFSIGMVLLQQAASAAAAFYDNVELTELHHNKKADAPSGTCIKTAEMIEGIGKIFNKDEVEEHESLSGCRGGQRNSGLRLHSIRLPGLVAHQEVTFGALGEIYTLRHDTVDRQAYMPGVLLAIKKVRDITGLVYGLERLI